MKLKNSIFLFLCFFLALVVSCSKDSEVKVPEGVTQTEDQKPDPKEEGSDNIEAPKEVLLEAQKANTQSSPLGNLVGQILQKKHQVDIVLYPSELLDKNLFLLVKETITKDQEKKLLKALPSGTRDEIIIGLMKGKHIKSFIRDRVESQFKADLQATGLSYKAVMSGGYLSSFELSRNEEELSDDQYYKVALSHHFYSYRFSFPGYYYGNGLNFNFKSLNKVVSLKETMSSFINENELELKELLTKNVEFQKVEKGSAGEKKIYEIQGESFLSPFYGFKVQTKGVVTAVSKQSKDHPQLMLYIQDPQGDGIDETSDAIEVVLKEETSQEIEVGDELLIQGTVYEVFNPMGLSQTSLREIESIQVLTKDNKLPPSITLGSLGRAIPHESFSRFSGNLNQKESLSLEDGLDFWESLEGMRVEISNPRIVGFNGGHQDYYDTQEIQRCVDECKEDSKCESSCRKAKRSKSYLSLYLKADGKDVDEAQTSLGGGVLTRYLKKDYNPELLMVTTDAFNRSLSSRSIFNMGDILKGKLEGVLTYQKNTFGDGEYVLSLPTKQELFDKNQRENVTPLDQRDMTSLVATENQLTVASYNIQNLGGDDNTRIQEAARVLSETLKCPDIINLVEIQDFNGVTVPGGSRAKETLDKLTRSIQCKNAEYKTLNINPVNHQEGGEPGGNIRVAMLYNSLKVEFEGRSLEDNSTFETHLSEEGSLTQNPGRIDPENPILMGTRKSLVAEFLFKGKKVFVIGNHFNSKLSDTSHLSALQPHQSFSNIKRVEIAKIVNNFVKEIEKSSPEALIVVLGDFNALIEEESMQALEGEELKNLMSLISPNDRYTTVHKGNSQPLDYIFVNKRLLEQKAEFEVPHINTDYMGALSDHDPVISRFSF